LLLGSEGSYETPALTVFWDIQMYFVAHTSASFY
jgi:hypothetical protein